MIALTLTRTIVSGLLLLTTIVGSSQVSDCPYILDVMGDPILGTVFAAEQKVGSGDTVTGPMPVTFSAPEICLDTNFSVAPGAVFVADTIGCIATCLPDPLPCNDMCASPLDDTTTMSGQRFVQHDLVLTFPDSINVDLQGSVILSLNGKTFNVRDTAYKYFPIIDPGAPVMDTLKRCLCDENIFLYENENLVFEEGCVSASNKKKGVSEEGGVYSLNYILENFEPYQPDSIAANTAVSFMSKGNLMPPSGSRIVAILDTGLDPSLVPNNSLYFNNSPGTFVCDLVDPTGWNFIDENNNLFDNRGHGSLVTLSYLHALANLKPIMDVHLSQILTVKVLNECGEGTTYSTVCGLKYAKEKGARLINTSWGTYQPNFPLQRAIDEVARANIKITCSAGNNGADLNTTPHFPSGYAAPHDHFITADSLAPRPGYGNVYEVTGACRFINTPCLQQRVNLPLERNANYRDTIFAEASKGIKQLLPPPLRPICQVQGTSYAAPQLTAGLLHSLVRTGTATKRQMIDSARQIHPDFGYYSYNLENCN